MIRPTDEALQKAREVVLAWSAEDTLVDAEPTEREAERLIVRVAHALNARAAEVWEEAARMASDKMPFIAQFDTREARKYGQELAADFRARAALAAGTGEQ